MQGPTSVSRRATPRESRRSGLTPLGSLEGTSLRSDSNPVSNMIPHCQALSSTTRIKYLISLHLFPTNGTHYCTSIQYFCANPLLSGGYRQGPLYRPCCFQGNGRCVRETDSYTTSGVGGRVLKFICTQGDPSPLVLPCPSPCRPTVYRAVPYLPTYRARLAAHAPTARRYQPARHPSAPPSTGYGGRGRGYPTCPYGQGAGAIAGRVPLRSSTLSLPLRFRLYARNVSRSRRCNPGRVYVTLTVGHGLAHCSVCSCVTGQGPGLRT